MPAGDKFISAFLALAVAAACLSAFLVFSNRLPPYAPPVVDESAFAPPKTVFRKTEFDDLPGWRGDDHAAALGAFVRSCVVLTKDDATSVRVADAATEDTEAAAGGVWRAPCNAAADFAAMTFADQAARKSAARAFFEFHFSPVQILIERAPLANGPARGQKPRVEETGLFTGYFEPVYAASRWRTAVYSAPARRRPADLISVDLGAFRDDLAGERVAGRVEDGRLAPYPDRAEIEAAPADNIGEPIAWMRPNDLFFLQIQGSGVLRLPGGERLRVGFDGQNGRPYTAIGRVLVERGDMTLETVSMQSIRAWLEEATPAAAQELREANASYVFFKELRDLPEPSLGPLGAQEVQLTPGRSVAVDLRHHALGAPLWIALDTDETGAPPMRRLLIAQDTGGAIKGPMRGDIFWGSGAEAGEIAGAMRARGRLYMLVPKGAAPAPLREAAL
ncbi:MAG: murein transglycosylase A [Parvularculaceae bacterium]